MEGRLRLIVVAIVWVATLFAILAWVVSTREVRLSIAAGPRSGESFQLASAIAQVFNETVPNASIDVFETSGSAENARLLESGQVDVATMQADTHVHGGINALASLYFDAYQLIVTESSDIRSFDQLAGQRVAIGPAGSGQSSAFLFAAEHYGLSGGHLTALPRRKRPPILPWSWARWMPCSGCEHPVTIPFASWCVTIRCAWCPFNSQKLCRSANPP